MRTLRKNQQSMRYALQTGEVPVYQTDKDGNIVYDSYIDKDGNQFPYFDENGNKMPMETGDKEILYSEPQEFMASVSMSGGEAEAVEYGLSTADFQAVILYANGTVPLVEGALIWTKSNVEYKEVLITEDGEEKKLQIPQKTSSDYEVIKVNKALNFSRAILKAIVR